MSAHPTDHGEDAWTAYKATRRLLQDIADGADDKPLWTALDAYEAQVANEVADTPRAAERKLWLALLNSQLNFEDDCAAWREDFEHFRAQLTERIEFSTRCIVSAISTLRRTSVAAQ